MSLLYRKKSYVLATCPSCIFVSAMSSRLQRITPTSLVSLICSSASFGSLIRLSVAKSRETGTLWLTDTEPRFESWYFGIYLCKVIKVTEVPYALQGSIPGHDQCWRLVFSKAREAGKGPPILRSVAGVVDNTYRGQNSNMHMCEATRNETFNQADITDG